MCSRCGASMNATKSWLFDWLEKGCGSIVIDLCKSKTYEYEKNKFTVTDQGSVQATLQMFASGLRGSHVCTMIVGSLRCFGSWHFVNLKK